MEIVLESIRKFLDTKPTQSQLTDFMNHFEAQQVKPTVNFNQIDSKTLTSPTFVYARLMVQDMRESYFYISLAAERKEYYTPNDSFCLYKYGQITGVEPKDVEDSQRFLQVMTDRTLIICTEVRYQSKWLNELQKKTNKLASIQLEVDGECQFKLGQIINMVALYDPLLQKLFFVRRATQQQAGQQGFQIIKQLQSKEIDILSVRQKFMNYLCGFCSESFAQYLLAIMISQESLFLGCQANITPLIEDFYPRVAHFKIVHPCNEPLFPFKNEQSELQLTPMQMSSLPTFVVLDLSQFSKNQKVVLEGTQLKNFAALKEFVENGKTIYAWQMGEGHFDHKHRGVVVKAAKLLNPQFNPSNQQIFIDLSNGVKMSESQKEEIRAYLQKVLTIQPILQEEQRKIIQKSLFEQMSKINIGKNFGDIMKLAKLLARSEGRTSITFQNYQKGKSLVLNHQVPK